MNPEDDRTRLFLIACPEEVHGERHACAWGMAMFDVEAIPERCLVHLREIGREHRLLIDPQGDGRLVAMAISNGEPAPNRLYAVSDQALERFEDGCGVGPSFVIPGSKQDLETQHRMVNLESYRRNMESACSEMDRRGWREALHRRTQPWGLMCLSMALGQQFPDERTDALAARIERYVSSYYPHLLDRPRPWHEHAEHVRCYIDGVSSMGRGTGLRSDEIRH